MTVARRAQGLHSRLFLLAAVAVVSVSAVGPELSPAVQLGILALMVTLAGLPHGALDPLVAREAGIADDSRKMVLFLLAYLALTLITLAVWTLFPGLTLAAFLAFSAWHFAADWQGRLPRAAQLSGGAAVILAPMLFYPEDVRMLLAVLGGSGAADLMVTLMKWPAMVVIMACCLEALRGIKHDYWASLELVAIPILAASLPPLIFFSLYFCGLHSPRHILVTVGQLDAKGQDIALCGLLITALTVGLGLVWWQLPSAVPSNEKLLQIVFMGLAALTVPHMALMARGTDRP